MTVAAPPRKFVATVGVPYADESLLGYIGRALSVTAVRHVYHMLRLAGALKTNPGAITTTLLDPDEIERVAILLGCSPADIALRTYAIGAVQHSRSETMDFFGSEVRYHFRECKLRQVSPRALEIALYHRAIWDLGPVTFDPQTKEKMLRVCPACKRRLGWLRVDAAALCDKCGVDLRDFPQPVSPVDDEEAYDFVVGLVSPITAKKDQVRRLLPERWSDFSSGSLFEVAVALACGLTMDPAISARSTPIRRGREQFKALTPELLALAGRAIIGGEQGFARLCERYRADMEKRPHHYGRRKELGPLCYIPCDEHIDPKIRDLLGGLIDANMQATGGDFSLRKGPDADSSMLSIAAMAKKFGVRRALLQRLAESGLVPVVRAHGGVRSPVRMAVRDVMPLLVELKDAIGETAAVGILGLPHSVMPSLVESGLISRLHGPICGLLPDCRGYSKSSVESLIDKVWQAAGSADDKCCSIEVAVRPLGGRGAPWAAIVSAIISGDVEVFDKGTKRRNIRVSLAVADVPAFLAGVRKHLQGTVSGENLPEFVAQPTAAEILQVTVAFLSRLANSRPDLLPQSGPGYTPYRAADVRELAATYIFVPEIARRSNRHPRVAAWWLRAKGVQPALGLRENRDLGYPRSAVEPLLAELTIEADQVIAPPRETIRTRLIKAVAAGADPKTTAEAMALPWRQAERWVEIWRKNKAFAEQEFAARVGPQVSVGANEPRGIAIDQS